jgi:hypothetical protein
MQQELGILITHDVLNVHARIEMVLNSLIVVPLIF